MISRRQGRPTAVTRTTQLPGRKPLTKWGRSLRSHGRSRVRSRRDTGRHSSDEVWALVEKMISGDADAAIVLADLIEEGVSGGKTKFVKISDRGYKRGSYVSAPKVREGEFAAITPGRQIVLFGVKDRWNEDGKGGYSKRGYVSRYRVGDTAEYNSYNLVYFGTIRSISDKRIVIAKTDMPGSSKASLSIEQFSHKNWDPKNLEEGLKRNREWMD